MQSIVALYCRVIKSYNCHSKFHSDTVFLCKEIVLNKYDIKLHHMSNYMNRTPAAKSLRINL